MIFKSKIDKMIELNKIKVLKEKMIESVIERYKTLKPSKEAVESYRKDLLSLDEKELKFLVSKMDAMPVISPISKLRKLRKTKALLIHMYNKNGTPTHFIISSYSRYFTYQGGTYILTSKDINLDTTYKLNSYTFIEGIPTPIAIANIKNADDIRVDAKALQTVIKMEYVELLSKVSKVKDLILIAVVGSCLSALGCLIIIGLCLKGFGFIG